MFGIRKLAVAMAAMATLGALVTAGTAGTAHADEPGPSCTTPVSGTITASSSTVTYGQLVTVTWNVSAPYCDGIVAFVDGPGFTSADNSVPLGGSRTVRALVSGPTATWRVIYEDLYTDSPVPWPVASVTINVQ